MWLYYTSIIQYVNESHSHHTMPLTFRNGWSGNFGQIFLKQCFSQKFNQYWINFRVMTQLISLFQHVPRRPKTNNKLPTPSLSLWKSKLHFRSQNCRHRCPVLRLHSYPARVFSLFKVAYSRIYEAPPHSTMQGLSSSLYEVELQPGALVWKHWRSGGVGIMF